MNTKRASETPCKPVLLQTDTFTRKRKDIFISREPIPKSYGRLLQSLAFDMPVKSNVRLDSLDLLPRKFQ